MAHHVNLNYVENYVRHVSCIRLWDSLPDEIVDQILISATKNSDEVLATYHSLLCTCSRFHRIIKEKSHTILPRLYIRLHDDVMKKLPTMHDKIKVSVTIRLKLA